MNYSSLNHKWHKLSIIKLDYLIQFKLATKIFVKDTPIDTKKPMIDTKT